MQHFGPTNVEVWTLGGVNLGEGPRAYERAIPTESASTACTAGCVPGVHSRVRLSWAIAEG